MDFTGNPDPLTAEKHTKAAIVAVLKPLLTCLNEIFIITVKKMKRGRPEPELVNLRPEDCAPHDQFLIPYFMALPSRPAKQM